MATSLKASGNAFNNNNMRNIKSVITFLIHKEMLHSENSVKEFFKSLPLIYLQVLYKN